MGLSHHGMANVVDSSSEFLLMATIVLASSVEGVSATVRSLFDARYSRQVAGGEAFG